MPAPTDRRRSSPRGSRRAEAPSPFRSRAPGAPRLRPPRGRALLLGVGHRAAVAVTIASPHAEPPLLRDGFLGLHPGLVSQRDRADDLPRLATKTTVSITGGETSRRSRDKLRSWLASESASALAAGSASAGSASAAASAAEWSTRAMWAMRTATARDRARPWPAASTMGNVRSRNAPRSRP